MIFQPNGRFVCFLNLFVAQQHFFGDGFRFFFGIQQTFGSRKSWPGQIRCFFGVSTSHRFRPKMEDLAMRLDDICRELDIAP